MLVAQRSPSPSAGAAQRALLHPLWLGGLVVLALNDHVFKGGDLLPEIVTGKLSDIAGMFVAPAVLATALGVKTRRGWIAAHLAVGAVFSAIKLSPAIASLWSALMGAFGFAWTIVVDPTDVLVAIPALLLGMHVLGRAMTTAPARLVRRSAEATAAGIGLMCSVATSPPPSEPGEEWPEEEWLPDVNADVWLHNGTGVSQVIRVRPLLSTVRLDCDAIESDPAGLLSDALFGQVQSWTVPNDANLPVLDPGVTNGLGCRIALVDADDFAPVILFWRVGSPAATWIPGLGVVAGEGAIELVLDTDDRGHFETSSDLVFPRGESSEPTGECAAQDDAYRVDWGDAIPQGTFRIVSMSYGVDGCTALELAYPMDESGSTQRTYLCTPPLDLPFAAGDEIAIRMEYGVESESVVVEQTQAPVRRLVVSRGGSAPIVSGLQIAVAPLYGCDYSVDACGTVAQSSAVTLGGGNYPTAQVMFGAEPAALDGDDGSTITVAIAHAQHRVALDSECAAGSDGLGDDLELALVIAEPEQ
jgi:hypothetical protein